MPSALMQYQQQYLRQDFWTLSMTRTKLVHWSALVGLNLFVLTTLMVAFELIFGTWFVPYVLPNPSKYDRTAVFHQEFYEPAGSVTYVRDKFGLRGVHGPLSSVQLVTVGGSTTDQTFLTEGATWQDVIRERTGISIANGGIDGMGSQSYPVVLDEWLHRIPELHPTHFLYYVGVNDAWMVQTVTAAERRLKYSWSRRIRVRSATLQAIGRLSAWLAPPLVVHGAVTVEGGVRLIEAKADRSEIATFLERMYRPNLRATIERNRARGEFVVLVSQTAHPALVVRVSDAVFVQAAEFGRWAIALGEINRATEAVCREYVDDCRFIDLANRVQFESSDFYDLVHNTPQGARKIGEFLSGELAFIHKAHR